MVYKNGERFGTLQVPIEGYGVFPRGLDGMRLFAKFDCASGMVSFSARSPDGMEEGTVSIPIDDADKTEDFVLTCQKDCRCTDYCDDYDSFRCICSLVEISLA